MTKGLGTVLRSCARCQKNVRSQAPTARSFSSRVSADGLGKIPKYRRQISRQVGGAAAVSLAALYIYSQPVKLDSRAGSLPDPSAAKDQSTGFGLIPYAEVQQHSSAEDCWVVIDGKIYDLTDFAQEGHPGGSGPIHQMAGRDATVIFKSIHPPGVIEHMLDPSAYKGTVDPATLPQTVSKEASGEEKEREITLGEVIGLPDFDEAARRKLTAKAWAYMSAGATDMHTLDLNRSSFNKILFRPRVLIDVDQVDSSTTMLGQQTSLPIFLSPTGMAGLAHPDGEKLLTKAAAEGDAIYMISTNASDPLADIVNARSTRSQPLFMQLYVDRNRRKAEALIHKINDLGLKAIFVTVDCAAPGKREADERSMAEIAASQKVPGMSGGKISRDKKGGGIARAKGGFIDPTLNWNDIAWLRRHTNLPIGLKGVQCVEDCVTAVEMGVDAIYLSNHGGRALDGSSPALYTLLELRKYRPDVFQKCEVYIDGGVRRGTDVVKALCLGATGVGLGRPILYSMTYGKEGILHALDILRDEVHTTMRLLGVTRLDQLGPHLLNTKALDPLVADADMLKPPAT